MSKEGGKYFPFDISNAEPSVEFWQKCLERRPGYPFEKFLKDLAIAIQEVALERRAIEFKALRKVSRPDALVKEALRQSGMPAWQRYPTYTPHPDRSDG